ncbi:motility protein A [Nitrospina watsonii]|uniref:Flagellar motor rotation protein MotA n=1 Tax=Nitrospina watsonii TaxID=1323948 RepID=A0ABN8VY86_9BACT|nr:MotA/TolQ/ExbB proton channel family protein [Nitrospina watsonii]CAI2718161.1 Flagellar motor rotation protein MotA [Nitrospina watsonii]
MATAVKESETISGLVDGRRVQPDSTIDIGTILGTMIGVALIAWAIVRGGNPETFLNLNAVLIVFGGTIATSFIAYPSSKIISLIGVIINAYRPDNQGPATAIEQIMQLATKYRTGGIKRLKNEEEHVENRFLKTGIGMIVDGYNSREIHEILDREMNSMIERHQRSQKILQFMAVQSPIFGMGGTLIGLVQMLMHIDNPDSIGPSLATALITTFYGIMLANLIITPVVAKLNHRTESEALLCKIIRVGIMGIHDRTNPQKIRRNMNALLSPEEQK